jgi:Fe-S oxidoreductase
VYVLRSADVSFGFLGTEEPCCGEAVLSVGHKPYFEEIAFKTAEIFRERGITKIATISPHCYDVFKNHYPDVLEHNGILPYHYTQYLVDLVEEGRLEFPATQELKITFQDPCYLGRHNDEYEAPRRLLAAIPGVEFVEMENHGVDGLCCGGGGGRMWLETEPGERFSDLRVIEAARTGANILATACPFCVVCLEDSAKAAKMKSMQVLDVAEVIALALSG